MLGQFRELISAYSIDQLVLLEARLAQEYSSFSKKGAGVMVALMTIALVALAVDYAAVPGHPLTSTPSSVEGKAEVATFGLISIFAGLAGTGYWIDRREAIKSLLSEVRNQIDIIDRHHNSPVV